MRKLILFFLLAFPLSAQVSIKGGVSMTGGVTIPPTSGGGGGGSTLIPAALGWYQIPSSNPSSVNPGFSDIQATTGPTAVQTSWGTGGYSPFTNTYWIWGGGHNDYYGNEIYCLSLSVSLTMSLCRNASTGANLGTMTGNRNSYNDGSQSSQHGYSGTWYIPQADKWFHYGAGLPPGGNLTSIYWNWDPVNSVYNQYTTPGTAPNPAGNGSIPLMGYLPSTGKLYFFEDNVPNFWSWDWTSNTWTNIAPGSNGCNSKTNITSVVDESRSLFILMGQGCAAKINMTTGAATNLTATGCSAITSVQAPGLTYDPNHQDIIGWAGGNDIVIYNPGTDSCATQTYTGGPGAALANGTHNRLRFDTADGVVIISNGMTNNIYSWRRDSQPTLAQNDWNARCAASGVIVCRNISTSGDVTNNSYSFGPSPPTANPNAGFDNTTYPTTTQSWKFTVTTNGGAGTSGYLAYPFSTSGTDTGIQNFGQNSDFYVQYRARWDANLINQTYKDGSGTTTYWKQSIFHWGQFATSNFDTCDQIEITTINYNNKKFPGMYSACGANPFTPSFGGSNFLLESGTSSTALGASYDQGFNCYFNSPYAGGCSTYQPLTWYTFYYHVHIGTFGSANSHVDAYIATPGGEYRQFENVTTTINANTPSTNVFNYATLLPYMTGRSGSFPVANPGYYWVADLIVSSQPIAAPKGPVAAP